MCRVWCKQTQSPISSSRWVSCKHVKTHDSLSFFFELSPLSSNQSQTSTVSPNLGCCDWRISELWPVVSKLSEGSLERLQTQACNLQILANFSQLNLSLEKLRLEFEDFQIRVRVEILQTQAHFPPTQALGPAFTF